MLKFMFGAAQPQGLGVTAGKLKRVPPSPNCVSSQADPSDVTHYVEGIKYTQASAKDALTHMKKAIGDDAELVKDAEDESYLHYEYTTPLMGFVDDLEIYADDSTKTLHVRSASRTGYSDMGKNRARVEDLRTKLSK
ncbi:hypothetical protein SARC_01695 [Sphaeroforma arctica JP610]|uniref:DUF1499 domain-containing protein n=1 Tax=Sphaeroforma arctica JP610 TaxID=667725 RepID=A0A0L0GB93_9EUKA|nr:hypothetical protein SARC_01695 [Sphaeroforma arctica JP610]KNC86169.1 hypothetical protein SARC_01695 [Sphaeroforma arctica JP610]|eukprot:XP_014160071.1 hypothetical protein SARC_01695 [Sphaeroforma arctica JP610]